MTGRTPLPKAATTGFGYFYPELESSSSTLPVWVLYPDPKGDGIPAWSREEAVLKLSVLGFRISEEPRTSFVLKNTVTLWTKMTMFFLERTEP